MAFSPQILLFVLSINLIYINAAPELQLKFLGAVFRHGDRAPETNGNERFPNDPYVNSTFYPGGIGGLTNTGKKREYDLGQAIRERYTDFLGDIYSPVNVSAVTTDSERTKMSLQLVLAGMYPPTKAQQWNPNLNWQPAVTSYTPLDRDFIKSPELCPEYLDEYKRIKKTPEWQAKEGQFSELIKNVSEWSGKDIEGVRFLFHLYHALTAEAAMGLELPAWTNDVFPTGLLLNASVLHYEHLSYNSKLTRLNGGRVVKVFRDHLLEVVAEATKIKVALLSAHETTVTATLKALGVYTPHVPEYSSALFIELLANGDDYFVKLQYYRGIPQEFVELEIPGCASPCPVKNFVRSIEKVIPTEEEVLCTQKSADSKSVMPSAADIISGKFVHL